MISLPAQSPEPRQLVGVINSVADGDDFTEARDLHNHDLHQAMEKTGSVFHSH